MRSEKDQYVFCMRLALKIKQKRRFVGLEPAVIGRKNSSGWPHPETVRENHDLSLGERSSRMGYKLFSFRIRFKRCFAYGSRIGFLNYTGENTENGEKLTDKHFTHIITYVIHDLILQIRTCPSQNRSRQGVGSSRFVSRSAGDKCNF